MAGSKASNASLLVLDAVGCFGHVPQSIDHRRIIHCALHHGIGVFMQMVDNNIHLLLLEHTSIIFTI